MCQYDGPELCDSTGGQRWWFLAIHGGRDCWNVESRVPSAPLVWVRIHLQRIGRVPVGSGKHLEVGPVAPCSAFKRYPTETRTEWPPDIYLEHLQAPSTRHTIGWSKS
eukprot:1191922-Prorocentrum_minimum.AAC.3